MPSSRAAPPVLTRWVGPLPDGPVGVGHVAAVWAEPAGAYATLRVGPGAPTTASDAVVLSGARARADAIVTTGRILREEPGLVHRSIAPPPETAALDAWRRARGQTEPPLIAVLTRSGDVPEDHPALAAAHRVSFFTGAQGAARLRARRAALPAQLEIVEHPQPGARSLVAHLRDECGARSILVEAGPSASAELYAPSAVVDELWLTACLAERVAPADVVGPFIEREVIEAALGPPVHREQHEDAGLAWATLVHRRGSTGEPARRSNDDRAVSEPRPIRVRPDADR